MPSKKKTKRSNAREIVVTAKPGWSYGEAFRRGYAHWHIVWHVSKDGKTVEHHTECLWVLAHQPLNVKLVVPLGGIGYSLLPETGTDHKAEYVDLTVAPKKV